MLLLLMVSLVNYMSIIYRKTVKGLFTLIVMIINTHPEKQSEPKQGSTLLK